MNCSWEAPELEKHVDHYFSCRAIPSAGLHVALQLRELKENRRLNIAYNVSAVDISISSPFSLGYFVNGIDYLEAGTILTCTCTLLLFISFFAFISFFILFHTVYCNCKLRMSVLRTVQNILAQCCTEYVQKMHYFMSYNLVHYINTAIISYITIQIDN